MANYPGLYRKLLDKVLGGFVQPAPCNHGADGIWSCSNCKVTIDDVTVASQWFNDGPPFRKDPLLQFNTLPRAVDRRATNPWAPTRYKADDDFEDRITSGKIEAGAITGSLFDIHFEVGRFPVDQPTERIEVAGYDPQYSDGVVPEQIIEPREAREITNWTDTIIQGDWFTDGRNQFLITEVAGTTLHIRKIN